VALFQNFEKKQDKLTAPELYRRWSEARSSASILRHAVRETIICLASLNNLMKPFSGVLLRDFSASWLVSNNSEREGGDTML
jgi:hypothetical protein